jgi:hypothetical protein
MHIEQTNKNEHNNRLSFPHCCRNLVLSVPIDTLGETSSAQVGDAERDGVWWVLLVKDNYNLGSYKLCTNPTNSSIVGTQIL